jgi:hypothetical protein
MQEYRDRVAMLQTLKVGDEIGVSGYSHGIHQIVKIRRYKGEARQFELENGQKFDKMGRKIDGGFYNRYTPILIAIADVHEINAREQAQRKTNERVQVLLDEIARHRTGAGDYHIDADDREKMLNLVISL